MEETQWTLDKIEKSIPASTRNRVKNRDGNRCQRCFSCQALQVHHLHQRQCGGGHEDTNLITLCRSCHREWHRYEPDFDKWLSTVKPSLFLAAQMSDSCGLTQSEVFDMMPKVWDMIKTLNSAEADDSGLGISWEPLVKLD